MFFLVILYKPLDSYIFSNIEFITKRSKEKAYSHRKDEMTIKRLNEISEVFNELGQTFKNSVENNNTNNVKEVYELIDNVANCICSNCGMKKFCWEEGFYTTYHSMFKTISLIGRKYTLKR